MHGIWKNNKTGNLYEVIGTAIDATNATDSRPTMVVYHEYNFPAKMFVREEPEFLKKFTQISNVPKPT